MMQTENLKASTILLVAIAHPEALRVFLPPTSSIQTVAHILKIDFARTLIVRAACTK
jgi:hypothetical protein